MSAKGKPGTGVGLRQESLIYIHGPVRRIPIKNDPAPARSLPTTLALARTQPWMQFAVCHETDPDLFFPEGYNASYAEARAICANCPVRIECLDYALSHGEQGVWGGTSDRERQRIRAHNRQQQEAAS